MQMRKKRFQIWETAALLALSLCLCTGAWAQGKQTAISGSLVRLHVLAVSDDAEEQALKLRVRDAVLAYLRPRLSAAESAQEAKAILQADLDGIARAAAAAAEGRAVRVSLAREAYPTRAYETFTLPAGSYDSLRVVLGRGEGHNWWCVVFPPLCLSAAEAEPVQGVMRPDGYALISEEKGRSLRFKTVELWGEITSHFAK